MLREGPWFCGIFTVTETMALTFLASQEVGQEGGAGVRVFYGVDGWSPGLKVSEVCCVKGSNIGNMEPVPIPDGSEF